MSDRVDELFEQFKAARAARRARGRGRAAGRGRRQRASRAGRADRRLPDPRPAPGVGPEAYERSWATHAVQAVSASLRGQAGLWPSLLPRLRNRARIKRGDLAAELAERLGAEGQTAEGRPATTTRWSRERCPPRASRTPCWTRLGAIVGVGARYAAQGRRRRSGRAPRGRPRRPCSPAESRPRAMHPSPGSGSGSRACRAGRGRPAVHRRLTAVSFARRGTDPPRHERGARSGDAPSRRGARGRSRHWRWLCIRRFRVRPALLAARTSELHAQPRWRGRAKPP